MGRKTKVKKVTGPGESDAPGPGGEGGIVPASTPSSSHDGQEGRRKRSATSQTSKDGAAAQPRGPRPRNLATWAEDAGLVGVSLAEIFREAEKDHEELCEATGTYVWGLSQLTQGEEVGPAVIQDARAFSIHLHARSRRCVQMIAELVNREFTRLEEEREAAPDPGRNQGTQTEEAPDPGKEVRDRGIQTEVAPYPGNKSRNAGTQTMESGASSAAAPMPAELETRLEEISSMLADSSDRLGLVERRLGELVGGEGVTIHSSSGILQGTPRGKEGGTATGEWTKVLGRGRRVREGEGDAEKERGRGGGGVKRGRTTTTTTSSEGEGATSGGIEGRRRRRGGVGVNEATDANVMGAPRCYRCLCVGHTWRRCTSAVDRGSRCYNCGSPGHKEAGCLAGPRCPLCVDFLRPARCRHRLGERGCLATPPAGPRGGGLSHPSPPSVVAAKAAAAGGGGDRGGGTRKTPASIDAG